jgi:hypothetical protein
VGIGGKNGGGMGGVDTFGQNIKNATARRRNFSWRRCCFLSSIVFLFVNMWVVHKQQTPTNQKPKQLLEFLDHIKEDFISLFIQSRKREKEVNQKREEK